MMAKYMMAGRGWPFTIRPALQVPLNGRTASRRSRFATWLPSDHCPNMPQLRTGLWPGQGFHCSRWDYCYLSQDTSRTLMQLSSARPETLAFMLWPGE